MEVNVLNYIIGVASFFVQIFGIVEGLLEQSIESVFVIFLSIITAFSG